MLGLTLNVRFGCSVLSALFAFFGCHLFGLMYILRWESALSCPLLAVGQGALEAMVLFTASQTSVHAADQEGSCAYRYSPLAELVAAGIFQKNISSSSSHHVGLCRNLICSELPGQSRVQTPAMFCFAPQCLFQVVVI